MSMLIENQKILDTLKFKDGRFFLKEFHIQRTYEACFLVNPKIDRLAVVDLYARIEKQYSVITPKQHMMRIVVTANNPLSSRVEVIAIEELRRPLKLQLLENLNQPRGEGVNNLKWEHREFWTNALNLKRADADDIISVNTINQATETSRFNLFFYSEKDRTVYTPTLESGCINGVYRRHVLHERRITLPNLGSRPLQEKDVNFRDVPLHQIYAANSVREVLRAQLV